MDTGVHVAGISKVLEAHNTVIGIGTSFVHRDRAECFISLGTASRKMVPLIISSALLLTVANTLTLAFDSEDFSLITEFTLTNLHSPLIFKLVSILWRGDLDQNKFVCELVILKSERGTHKWL